MRQKTMLGIVGPDAYGTWIPILDFNVDVADSGIKRARSRVRWRTIIPGTPTGKEDHARRALLKARCVGSENERGTFDAISYQSNSRPNINSLSESIAPGWNKKDSKVRCLLDSVNGLLYAVRIIPCSIGLHWELVWRQVNGFCVVQASSVVGT
jgi:hypothetical protein